MYVSANVAKAIATIMAFIAVTSANAETIRVPTLTESPYHAIGKMYVADRENGADHGWCTISFTGEFQAHTAWHCVSSSVKQGTQIRIVPRYVLGEPSCGDADIYSVNIVRKGEDKAIITLDRPAPHWVEYCGTLRAGMDVKIVGYPVNYDGGEVPQVADTKSRGSDAVALDWGGGGSGSPVYADGCQQGILVTILDANTNGVQRRLVQ